MIIRSIITISLVLVTIAEDVSENNIIDKNTESSLQKRTGGHHHGTGKVCQYLEQKNVQCAYSRNELCGEGFILPVSLL